MATTTYLRFCQVTFIGVGLTGNIKSCLSTNNTCTFCNTQGIPGIPIKLQRPDLSERTEYIPVSAPYFVAFDNEIAQRGTYNVFFEGGDY